MKPGKSIGHTVHRGFTLIELMIVVAVIGVLAAIAIPQYQDYVARSRWADNLSLVTPLKQAIAECMQANNGQLATGFCDSIPNLQAPSSGFLAPNWQAPDATNSKYLGAALTMTATGVITLVGNDKAANCQVTLTPTLISGQTTVRWDAVTDPSNDCNRTKTGVGS